MGCNLTMTSQHVSTPLSRCYDNGMYYQSGYQEIWHHQQLQQQHQHQHQHIQIQQQQQQQHSIYRDSHQEQKHQDQWKRFEHHKSKESHNKYYDRVSSCTSRTNTTSSPARKSHHDKHKLQGSRHNYLTQFSQASTTSKGSNTVTATKSLLLQPPVSSLYFSSRESPLWSESFAQSISNSIQPLVLDFQQEERGMIFDNQYDTSGVFSSSHITPLPIMLLRPENIAIDNNKNGSVLGSGTFSDVIRVSLRDTIYNGSNHRKDSNLNEKQEQQKQKQQQPYNPIRRNYALKHLKANLLSTTPVIRTSTSVCTNNNNALFVKAASELAREAYLLSRIRHPHVVRLVGTPTDGVVESFRTGRRHDSFFLVMELLNEETLDGRIKRWNREDQEQRQYQYQEQQKDDGRDHSIIRNDSRRLCHLQTIEQLMICRQLSDALEYIHSNAIVYRDLKPSNIGFLSTTNETPVHVKLLDFGLARELPIPRSSSNLEYDDAATLSPKTYTSYDMTGLVGTMRYMAPEVCLNQRYGLECDIYSWSIVAYGILTKRTPFEDMTPDMYQIMVCKGGYRPPIIVRTNCDAHSSPACSTHSRPPVLSKEYKVLLQQTWKSDPSRRLSFTQIKQQLDLFLLKEKLMYELSKDSMLPPSYM